VVSKKTQLGLFTNENRTKPRKFYAENVACIFELIAQGFNFEEIGKCFNVKGVTIQRTINDAKSHGFSHHPLR
jgi:hypothetical protein